MWSAFWGILTLSNVAVASILHTDLLKTVDNVLSAESIVRSLSDPIRRSGAADCDLELQRFSDALSRKELWALKGGGASVLSWGLLIVLDSSSYIISGLLQGNTAALGNYDECLEAAPPDNRYWPLYSLVTISVEQKKNTSENLTKLYDLWHSLTIAQNSTMPGSKNVNEEDEPQSKPNLRVYSAHFDGYDRKRVVCFDVICIPLVILNVATSGATSTLLASSIYDIFIMTSTWRGLIQLSTSMNMFTLHLGICWIRSCGMDAPGKAVASVLAMAEESLTSTGYRLRVAPPSPGSEEVGLPLKLGRADWAVISLCIVIGFVVLFGTILDIAILNNPVARGNPGWKLGFLAFSVYSNGRRLLTVGPNSPDALTAICGLKVISILWVMLGHRYRFMVDVPYLNKLDAFERVKDLDVEIILGGPLAVDTFFTIGGILNTYVYFIAMSKGRKISVVQFFIHRYVRLTPALALMTAITSTWLFYVSSGPIWLKFAGEARASCQANWWATLLYVSNYLYPKEQCMMQSWYLMVDMQLHWFSILVLLPLWRWRKVALGWLVFLIGLSCAIPFLLVYFYKYRTPLPTKPLTDPGEVDTSMETIYFPAHSRATSYLVGLLLGYYLYRARYVVHRFRLGVWTVVAGWTLSCLLFLIAIFAAYPLYQFDKEISIWSSAFYVGFYRLAWSLSIGWIIVACGTGYGGPVNGFLSWSPFIVLSRLVYGMYLTHLAVQIADIGSMRSSFHYNDFNMVEKAFSDFAMSTGLGLILCLAMESPIIALEKILLFRPARGAASQATVATPRRSNESLNAAPPGVDNPSLDTVDVVSEKRQPQTNL